MPLLSSGVRTRGQQRPLPRYLWNTSSDEWLNARGCKYGVGQPRLLLCGMAASTPTSLPTTYHSTTNTTATLAVYFKGNRVRTHTTSLSPRARAAAPVTVFREPTAWQVRVTLWRPGSVSSWHKEGCTATSMSRLKEGVQGVSCFRWTARKAMRSSGVYGTGGQQGPLRRHLWFAGYVGEVDRSAGCARRWVVAACIQVQRHNIAAKSAVPNA
jgi:hypothetical protein